MGVMVNGVEIPIQVGQKWLCRDGSEAEVLHATGDYTFMWWCRRPNGGTVVTREGRFYTIGPHRYDFTRLLSGPGSEATAPATEAPTQPEVTKAALALAELASRMFEDSQSYWAGKVSDIAKSLAALSGEPQVPTPEVTKTLTIDSVCSLYGPGGTVI